MKSIKYAAIAALMSTSFITSPAFADGTIGDQTASTDTTTYVDGQCGLLEDSLNASATAGQSFTVESEIGSQSSEWGTEVSRVIDESTREAAVGATVLSVANVDASAATNLVRNGKSPNIFATDAVAHTVTYSNTTYDYDGLFNISTTFEYNCAVTQHIPASQGPDEVETEGQCASRVAQDDAIKALEDYTNPGLWCLILSHRLSVPGDIIEASDPRRTDLDADGTVVQAGTAHDTRTEENGGQATLNNQSLPVAAVVCISPTKNPGTWRTANLYSNAPVCSRELFDSLAPYTIIPSASLPLV